MAEKMSDWPQWLQGEGHGEKPATAARIYKANAGSIRTSMKRARRLQKKGQGGHNKILSDTQTKAIEAYCYEQWEEDIPSGDDDSIASVDSIARCKFC